MLIVLPTIPEHQPYADVLYQQVAESDGNQPIVRIRVGDTGYLRVEGSNLDAGVLEQQKVNVGSRYADPYTQMWKATVASIRDDTSWAWLHPMARLMRGNVLNCLGEKMRELREWYPRLAVLGWWRCGKPTQLVVSGMEAADTYVENHAPVACYEAAACYHTTPRLREAARGVSIQQRFDHQLFFGSGKRHLLPDEGAPTNLIGPPRSGASMVVWPSTEGLDMATSESDARLGADQQWDNRGSAETAGA